MPDMRFAPPNPLRIADRASGLNATSVRGYNERLVLSLLLQNDGITRQEIGDKTGLTFQTISVLLRSLEQEGLVAKGEVQRGRKGAPTTPVVLNPEGAYSVGISVGHKYTDLVLINFVGDVRFHSTLPNPDPDEKSNHPAFLETINEAIKMLPKGTHDRIAGIGLALPETGAIPGETAAPSEQKYIALQEEIETEIGYSVFVQNDITAAAGGESMFGAAKPLSDYLFFYLGADLHSRMVLNHQIYNGNSPLSFDVGIASLETALEESGIQTDALWDRSSDWPDYGDALVQWEEKLIGRMKMSIEALQEFADVQTVILSSYAPQKICQALCEALEKTGTGVNAIAGIINPSPKAVGAASLPFSSRFMVE